MQPGKLVNPILHESVQTAGEHHAMMGKRYAPLAAAEMFREGRRTSKWKLLTTGPSAFLRAYVLKSGYRDGVPGISIAMFAAHHAFLKHMLLWEMQNEKRSDGD